MAYLVRGPCTIPVLIRSLSCCLPGRSAAMGSQIDKKAEAGRTMMRYHWVVGSIPTRGNYPGPSPNLS
jgi:hypothetical protein